jgi:hypothetical protein
LTDTGLIIAKTPKMAMRRRFQLSHLVVAMVLLAENLGVAEAAPQRNFRDQMKQVWAMNVSWYLSKESQSSETKAKIVINPTAKNFWKIGALQKSVQQLLEERMMPC